MKAECNCRRYGMYCIITTAMHTVKWPSCDLEAHESNWQYELHVNVELPLFV